MEACAADPALQLITDTSQNGWQGAQYHTPFMGCANALQINIRASGVSCQLQKFETFWGTVAKVVVVFLNEPLPKWVAGCTVAHPFPGVC